MKTWILYAPISMVFAGFTSVIAKIGLAGISGELGLALRSCFVFLFVLAFAAVSIPGSEFAALGRNNYFWLGLSGVTTAISWVFYYKALKEGEVSTVALIDKGSMVVSILLAVVILKEQLTARTLTGAALMVAGLLIVARQWPERTFDPRALMGTEDTAPAKSGPGSVGAIPGGLRLQARGMRAPAELHAAAAATSPDDQIRARRPN